MNNKKLSVFVYVRENNLQKIDEMTSNFWKRRCLYFRNEKGMTPLMVAIENGLADMSLLLLKKGSDPNTYSNESLTPLLYSYMNNEIIIAKQLLDFGANYSRGVWFFQHHPYEKPSYDSFISDAINLNYNFKYTRQDLLNIFRLIYNIPEQNFIKYKTLLKQGEALYNITSYKDLEKAAAYFKEAIKYADHLSQKLYSNTQRAKCFYMLKEFDIVFKTVGECFDYLETMKQTGYIMQEYDYECQAKLFTIRGSCYYLNYEIEKAKADYDSGFIACEKFKNNSDIKCELNIYTGNYFRFKNEYESSNLYFFRAYDIIKSKFPDDMNLDQIILDVVYNFIKIKDFVAAAKNLEYVEYKYGSKHLGIWSHITYTKALLYKTLYDDTKNIENLDLAKQLLSISLFENEWIIRQEYLSKDKNAEARELINFYTKDVHLYIDILLSEYDLKQDSELLWQAVVEVEKLKSVNWFFLTKQNIESRIRDVITSFFHNKNNKDIGFVYFFPSDLFTSVILLLHNSIHLFKIYDFPKKQIKKIALEIEKYSASQSSDKDTRNKKMESILEDVLGGLYKSLQKDFEAVLTLKNISRLIFIPHSYFNMVSLHAVYSLRKNKKPKYLMDQIDILYSDSINTAINNLQKDEIPWTGRVVVVQGYKTNKDKLEEIDLLRILHQKKKIKLEEIPSEKVNINNIESIFTGLLPGDCLFFIGHSSRDGFCIRNDANESGFDIYPVSSLLKLSLNPGCMWILGSCQTGLSLKHKGFNINNEEAEDFLSIEKVLIHSGIDAVSSFWSIDENMTALFMSYFFDNYFVKKKSRVNALKTAVKKIRNVEIEQGKDRYIMQIAEQLDEHPPAKKMNISLIHWAAFKNSI